MEYPKTPDIRSAMEKWVLKSQLDRGFSSLFVKILAYFMRLFYSWWSSIAKATENFVKSSNMPIYIWHKMKKSLIQLASKAHFSAACLIPGTRKSDFEDRIRHHICYFTNFLIKKHPFSKLGNHLPIRSEMADCSTFFRLFLLAMERSA